MNYIECHSRSRGSDVHNRDRALEFVMSGLVEKVTDCNHADSLAREIHSQSRCASGKQTRRGVEFLAAIAQVVPGYDKVGCTERRIGRKQNAIFTVPKSMAGGLRQRHRFDRSNHRVRFYPCGLQQRERNFLRQCWSAKTQKYKQNGSFGFKNRAKPDCQHNVSEGPTWPSVLVLTQCRAIENGPSVLLNSGYGAKGGY